MSAALQLAELRLRNIRRELARERRRRGRIFASCHDKGLTLDVLQYWGQIKGSEREAGGAETRRIGFHQSQLALFDHRRIGRDEALREHAADRDLERLRHAPLR